MGVIHQRDDATCNSTCAGGVARDCSIFEDLREAPNGRMV
jgi:hypothetical protein